MKQTLNKKTVDGLLKAKAAISKNKALRGQDFPLEGVYFELAEIYENLLEQKAPTPIELEDFKYVLASILYKTECDINDYCYVRPTKKEVEDER